MTTAYVCRSFIGERTRHKAKNLPKYREASGSFRKFPEYAVQMAGRGSASSVLCGAHSPIYPGPSPRSPGT
jgi:hypothetical protein